VLVVELTLVAVVVSESSSLHAVSPLATSAASAPVPMEW